jgi:hypothetical protein
MDLFSQYQATPRPSSLAPKLFAQRNKAFAAVPLAIVAGYVLGVPTSFFKRRGSTPWEPSDILVIGTIWAVVFVLFAVVAAVLFHGYVSLFRTGHLVVGHVAGPRGANSLVQLPSGLFALMLQRQPPPGTPVPVIVGTGRLVLLVLGPGEVQRASGVTGDEVARLP